MRFLADLCLVDNERPADRMNKNKKRGNMIEKTKDPVS